MEMEPDVQIPDLINKVRLLLAFNMLYIRTSAIIFKTFNSETPTRNQIETA